MWVPLTVPDWYTPYVVAWVTAVQVTVTFFPLVGVAQEAVAVGAVGNVVALASPALTVATWTVQLPAAQADPDEASRLRAALKTTTTRRAPRRLRGLPSSLPLAPRGDNEEIS
jgi:hypothetical protein